MSAHGDISEQELMAQYKAGLDQHFLGKLYSPYTSLVYGLCLKYFKNVAAAEDAVMEIYELVGKRLPNHDVENFRPWLYVVAKNYCLEKLRKSNTRKLKEKEAYLMYSEQVFHPDIKPNEALYERMKNCLEKLNESQKLCISAFYFEKKSYEQISEEHDLQWKSVRSNIQNGRRNLKTCIEKKITVN